jgi:hypothetical protein
MKATLEFKLPEDTRAFKLALAGHDMAIDIDSVMDRIRTWRKHGFPPDATAESIAIEIQKSLENAARISNEAQ